MAPRKRRIAFLADQNLVEPVVAYLRGRGHHVTKARDIGLASEEDDPLVQVALADGLIVVTHDPDFRSNALRAGCQCLWVQAPEVTARDRLRRGYEAVVALLEAKQPLVRVQPNGLISADPGRRLSRNRGGQGTAKGRR